MHTPDKPHIIFSIPKSLFADVDSCLAHFAEFRCPLCLKLIRQNGQGRDTLPNSAKWVSANCPIFIFDREEKKTRSIQRRLSLAQRRMVAVVDQKQINSFFQQGLQEFK